MVYGKLTGALRVLDTRLRSLPSWGLIILIGSAFELKAAVVTLAWDPSSSPNIAGYRLHSGTTSGVYSQTIAVGNTTTALVSKLIIGKTYFFVVTAYNTTGVESAASNEVSYLAPSSSATPTPTPSATPKLLPTPTATPASTATPTPSPGSGAVMLSPPPGSTFTSSSVTFSWSSGSSTNYALLLGDSPATANIYTSGSLHVQSTTANNIPSDGRNVYATLYSQVNNSWVSNSYVYKALTTSSTPTPTPVPTSTPTPIPTPSPKNKTDSARGLSFWTCNNRIANVGDQSRTRQRPDSRPGI